jgi:hypothetical protein
MEGPADLPAINLLTFDNNWRFDSPGAIEPDVANAFSDLINRICGQGNRHAILEHFKSRFAAAAGVPHHRSSNESWAATDLERVMDEAAANAPLFIEAFYDACQNLGHHNPEMVVPDAARINRLLAERDAGYEIRLPDLVATAHHEAIPVPEKPPALEAEAQKLIEKSLRASDRALAEGSGRQAVQEVLWLLETISTAFRGSETPDGSVQGRYFNKIIGELRRSGRGSHQEQILAWMAALHGFLSSPTGGGVRHGVDLKEGVAVRINEARLYCNLIRSYISYLISEHERMAQEAGRSRSR